jgi:hypothetical protein
VDGTTVESFTVSGAGERELAYEMDLDAGAHELRWDIHEIDSTAIYLHRVVIEGPIDPLAESRGAERAACAEALVTDFAPRVYRRPVSASESEGLSALYAAGSEIGGFWDGLDALFAGLFQSPKFLYLIEHGSEESEHRELTPWETAARLSYSLCERPPSGEVVQAAIDGSIADAEVRGTLARTLLASSGCDTTLSRFYQQWLWLDRLPDAARDPLIYPSFDAALRQALLDDSLTTLRELTLADGATLPELFNSAEAFVSPATAAIWGVRAPDAAATRVTLPPERAGVLTHPALMAVTSKFDATSPVFRGVFVLKNLLCSTLPNPPPTVDTTPPAPDPTMTTRERFAAHTDNPECAACHQQIDPIGFALEDFDAIGRHRTSENGLPIDSVGGVPSIGIGATSLSGGAELGRALATTPELERCFSRSWLRFALGRYERADGGDAATLEIVGRTASLNGVAEALVELVKSPTFVTRRLP